MTTLALYVEALLFVSSKALSTGEIAQALTNSFGSNLDKVDILAALHALKERYQSDAYAFELLEIAEGFQFRTKPAYHPAIKDHLKAQTKKQLSQSALETLAIIAYKQPVTKAGIEEVRGVNSDYAVKRLLEKGLISMKGKSDQIGRPVLYGTSDDFLHYFGLKSIKDLPTLKELEIAEDTLPTN